MSSTAKFGYALLGAMQFAREKAVDEVLNEEMGENDGNTRVLGYVDEYEPVFLLELPIEIPEYDQLPMIPATEFGVLDIEEVELMEAQSIDEWLQEQRDVFELWKTEKTFSPPTPLTVEGLMFYILNDDYVVKYDMVPPEQINKIHPDGAVSIRIRRVDSVSGAQVILDKEGNIISPGEPGAGTEDIFSPTNLSLTILHFFGDYLPWLISR